MQRAVEVNGYTYYFSTLYGCWMMISPTSGFHPRLMSEAAALSIIYRESGAQLRETFFEDREAKFSG